MRYRQDADGVLLAIECNRKVVQLRPTLAIDNIACILHAYGTLTMYSYHGHTPTCAYEYERAAHITRRLIHETVDGELLAMGQLWYNKTHESLLLANTTIATVIGDTVVMSKNGIDKLNIPDGLNPYALTRKLTHAYHERIACTH